MTGNVTKGIAAGLLSALLLLGVGITAYQAGTHRDPVVVTDAAGGEVESVRVVDGWRGGWHGGPPFGLFFLALFAGLILFALFSRRRWGYGWGGPCGPGDEPGGRQAMMAEWHRRAHEEAPGSGSSTTGG